MVVKPTPRQSSEDRSVSTGFIVCQPRRMAGDVLDHTRVRGLFGPNCRAKFAPRVSGGVNRTNKRAARQPPGTRPRIPSFVNGTVCPSLPAEPH